MGVNHHKIEKFKKQSVKCPAGGESSADRLRTIRSHYHCRAGGRQRHQSGGLKQRKSASLKQHR